MPSQEGCTYPSCIHIWDMIEMLQRLIKTSLSAVMREQIMIVTEVIMKGYQESTKKGNVEDGGTSEWYFHSFILWKVKHSNKILEVNYGSKFQVKLEILIKNNKCNLKHNWQT